jgi:aspartyl-tRNA synthetase
MTTTAQQKKLDWRRTHTCGELRSSHVGQTVTLNGWVAARRDHGGIYFVDLRDRYGLTQVVLGPEQADAAKLGPEFTISVHGKVVARDKQNINPERATGEIDVVVDRLEILSRSKTPPFPIDGDEEVALETRSSTATSICAATACRRTSCTARASSTRCGARSSARTSSRSRRRS